MSSTTKRIQAANRLNDLANIADFDNLVPFPLVTPFKTTIELTEAQVRSANTARPLVVPGISGFLIVPIAVCWLVDIAAGFSANPLWALQYANRVLDLHTTIGPGLNTIGRASAWRICSGISSSVANDSTGSGLVWGSNAAITGGAFTKNRLTVWYFAFDLDPETA
jgi:hypothetical protein